MFPQLPYFCPLNPSTRISVTHFASPGGALGRPYMGGIIAMQRRQPTRSISIRQVSLRAQKVTFIANNQLKG